jgi:hypothetical protein
MDRFGRMHIKALRKFRLEFGVMISFNILFSYFWIVMNRWILFR